MNHSDHVHLLEGDLGIRDRLALPIRGEAGIWADIGAGSGAFTLALADLLGPSAVIYAVDRDRSALDSLNAAMRRSFPHTSLHMLPADFTRGLSLPPLDGIVMANALHFLSNRAKLALLTGLRSYLRPGGQLVMVEYGTDKGNMWVPHPLSYRTWEKLAASCGYTKTTQLSQRPSRFLGSIYSAVSVC
jgi:SAM-dependent methyltransferase